MVTNDFYSTDCNEGGRGEMHNSNPVTQLMKCLSIFSATFHDKKIYFHIQTGYSSSIATTSCLKGY